MRITTMLRERLFDHRYHPWRGEGAETPVDAQTIPRDWISAPLCVSLIAVFLSVLCWTLDPRITRENGPIENAQAALLAFAAFLHVRHSFLVAGASARLCHGLLAALCASVVVREIDIHRLGTSPFWPTLELSLRAGLGLVWLVLGARALGRIRRLLGRRFALSRASLLSVAAVVLHFIGWSFERVGGLAPATAQLWEEAFQLCGAVFFFAASTHALGAVPRASQALAKESGMEKRTG